MKQRNLWAVIWPYFYTYRWPMLLDLFCAGLTTVSELVLPLLVRYLANLAAEDIGLLTLETIGLVAAAFIVLKLVEVLSGYYMSKMGHILGAKIETNMRSDIYAHLQTLPDSYYNETKVGQIMSRLTNDLFDITEFAHHCPEEYTIGAIKFIIAFFILWRISPILTVAVYFLIPVMFWASSQYKSNMRRAQMEQRHHIGDLNANIEDSLLGIRVVKSFANEDIELKKFETENKEFLNIKRDFYTAMAGFNTVNRIFDGLMYLVVIAGGGLLMYRRTIDGSDMLAFVLYVQTLLSTVKRVVEFTEQFQKGMTGIERFADIMETESDLLEAEDAKELKDVQGAIRFDQVSFRYRPELDDVLYKFSLDVQPGEKIAIVGPSGSGKTTVSALIPRFYDVTAGAITIDGRDVRDLTLKSLRDHIGIVQQDVYLFSGSVLENIRYGKPDATDEEIITAAKQANAYDL